LLCLLAVRVAAATMQLLPSRGNQGMQFQNNDGHSLAVEKSDRRCLADVKSDRHFFVVAFPGHVCDRAGFDFL